MKKLLFITTIVLMSCITEEGSIRYMGYLKNSTNKKIAIISYKTFSNNIGGFDYVNDTFYLHANQELLVYDNPFKMDKKTITKTEVMFGDSLKVKYNDSFTITHYGNKLPSILTTPNYLLSSNRNMLNTNNYNIQEIKKTKKITNRKMVFITNEQDYLDAKKQ